MSFAELVKTSAANFAPFNPIEVPPDATACQECAAVPGTHVTVLKPPVVTNHVKSPTSVYPKVWVTAYSVILF